MGSNNPVFSFKDKLIDTINSFTSEIIEDEKVNPSLKLQFYLESSQALLRVCEYDFAQNFYNEALSLSGIKLELSGELGKRTKFQQDNLSQLIVKTEAATLPVNF